MQKRIKLATMIVVTLATTGMSRGQSTQDIMDVGALVYWANHCNLTPTADINRKIENVIASAEGDPAASLAFGAGMGAAQQQIMEAEGQGKDFCAENAREFKRSEHAGKIFLEW